MKIQIMKEIEPTITPIIRGLADSLPELSVKISSFIKSSVRDIKGLWKSVSPFFDKLDFNKIKVGIMGIAGAFAAAKIVNKILSIKKSVGDLFAIIRANPIAMVIEAIALLGMKAYETWRQMKESDLAEHFGSISLSAEEMDRVVGKILKRGNFEKLQKKLEMFDVLGEMSDKIEDSLSEIERINWKLSVGITLDLDENELYKQSIDEYVKNSYEYLEQAFQADYSLFEGNEKVQKAISEFYFINKTELYEKGKEIKDVMNKALEDNLLTLDETKEITNLLKQMEEIRSKLAQSEYDTKVSDYNAKRSALYLKAEEEAKLNGGALDPETYNELMKLQKEEAETMNQASREKYGRNKEALGKVFEVGSPEYESEERKIKQEYESEIEERNADIHLFGLNTIGLTYGKEISGGISKSDIAMDFMADFMYNKLNEFNKNGYVSPLTKEEIKDINDFENLAAKNFDIPNVSLSNIRELYKEIEPYEGSLSATKSNIERKMNMLKKEGKEIPENLKQSYTEIESALEYNEKFKFVVSEDPFARYAWEKVGAKVPKDSVAPSEIEKWLQREKKVNSPITDTIAFEHFASGYQKEAKYSKTSMNINIPTNVKADINKGLAQQFVNKSREYLKKGLEQPMNAGITADATVSAGAIDTSSFENSIVSSVVSSSADALQKAAEQASKIRVKKTGPEKPSGKISLIQGFATGSEYTPDTFIAGEKGAELITGSKGRKVFTALETGNIFSNIGKIKDTLVSAVGAVNVFDKLRKYDTTEENEGMKPERAVKPSKTVNNSSNFSVTVNNEIKIDGADSKDNDNLKDLIDRVLRKGTGEMIEKVKDAVISAIEMENERKARLQNE